MENRTVEMKIIIKEALILRASVASTAGFEPTAFRLGGERSIQLSYVDIYSIFVISNSECGTLRFELPHLSFP